MRSGYGNAIEIPVRALRKGKENIRPFWVSCLPGTSLHLKQDNTHSLKVKCKTASFIMNNNQLSSKFLRIFCEDIRKHLLEKSSSRKIISSNIKNNQRAAVLVPIANVANCPSILFTVRNKNLRAHNGEVSFPGGKIDQNEGVVHAAIREMYEELGIPMSSVRNLGLYHDAFAKHGMPVTPVVGMVESHFDLKLSTIHPSEDEVAAVFALPIFHLLDPSNSESYFQPISMTVDGVSHPRGGLTLQRFLGGPEPIWGLTSYILNALIKDIFTPCWDRTLDRIRREALVNGHTDSWLVVPSESKVNTNPSNLDFLYTYCSPEGNSQNSNPDSGEGSNQLIYVTKDPYKPPLC